MNETIINRCHLRAFVFFVFSSAFTLTAQYTTTSPYSRYGIGNLLPQGLIQNNSLGGGGIAFQCDSLTPFHINTLNPASHGSVRVTTFEAGIRSNTLSLETNNASATSSNVSLGYLAFAMPFTKWWGGSFGLMPYSAVGYEISDSDTSQNATFLYQGKGGLNKFYFSNGFKFKKISFGVNASYLFGGLENNSKVIFSDNGFYNIRRKNTINVSDFNLDYGIIYRLPLVNNWDVSFGLVGALNSNISATYRTFTESYIVGQLGFETVKDTIENSSNQGGVDFPLSYGGGIVLKRRQNIMISADYSLQKWSQSTFAKEQGGFSDQMKTSIGFQFIPDYSLNVNRSYFNRIYYRAGARILNDYLTISGIQLNELALAVGLGFPVGRNRHNEQFHVLNLGLEIGNRGTTDHNLVKERFINVLIGLTINSRWFIKPKFD